MIPFTRKWILSILIILGALGQVGPAQEKPQPPGKQSADDLERLRGSMFGRTGKLKERLIQDGASAASELAVTRGLQWLARQQAAQGHWSLDGDLKNDTAGTAFGLLPFLGAGFTHKEKNPFDLNIARGMVFLVGNQNKQNGDLGGGMYAHALAAIALCELYGLSQDQTLRQPAQKAVDYIIQAQHEEGGWRYAPGQKGDMSVTGWQVMALKTAQLAGLTVPEATFRKAMGFMDSVKSARDHGYGYTAPGSTPTMTAEALLCRQYLQNWGSNNPQLTQGINNHLMSLDTLQIKLQPGRIKNIYYHYHASQVLHHFGGKAWVEWNKTMRDHLIATQDKNLEGQGGSWPAAGDAFGSVGGRLMMTSLALLTLEIYYRHVPLRR